MFYFFLLEKKYIEWVGTDVQWVWSLEFRLYSLLFNEISFNKHTHTLQRAILVSMRTCMIMFTVEWIINASFLFFMRVSIGFLYLLLRKSNDRVSCSIFAINSRVPRKFSFLRLHRQTIGSDTRKYSGSHVGNSRGSRRLKALANWNNSVEHKGVHSLQEGSAKAGRIIR